MDHGFGAQEETAGELTLGHGSAEVSRVEPDFDGVSAFGAVTTPGAFAASAQVLAAPPTPLNTIIARLEAAAEQLTHANERLAGASGRLGTSNPGREQRGSGESPSNGPGFIGTANDRIDYIISCVEATSTLASVFCEAV